MNGSLLDFQTEERILHANFLWLVEALEWLATIIDVAAIAILVIGAARFIVGYIGSELRRDRDERVRRINGARVELGRYILSGLELFIVSDIVHAALSLRFSDLLFLGLLVVIRSIISYFLERELEQLKQELGAT